jgi:hypothetical protein
VSRLEIQVPLVVGEMQGSGSIRDVALLFEANLQLLSRCCLLGSLEAFFTADDLLHHFQEALAAAIHVKNVRSQSLPCLQLPGSGLAETNCDCRYVQDALQAQMPTNRPS